MPTANDSDQQLRDQDAQLFRSAEEARAHYLMKASERARKLLPAASQGVQNNLALEIYNTSNVHKLINNALEPLSDIARSRQTRADADNLLASIDQHFSQRNTASVAALQSAHTPNYGATASSGARPNHLSASAGHQHGETRTRHM